MLTSDPAARPGGVRYWAEEKHTRARRSWNEGERGTMGSIGGFLKRIRTAPPGAMSQVMLDPNQVSPRMHGGGTPFVAGQHYFTIRLKTLHLESGRDWFTTHLPLLSTAAEYVYGTAQTTVPMAFGPKVIAGNGGKLPTRIDFDDVRLCGITPYRGGDLTLSMMLSQVNDDPGLRRLLGFIEAASSVLKSSGVIVPYAPVVELVASTLDDLAKDGDAPPLFGATIALSQDNGSFRSGHLLIAATNLTAGAVYLVDGEARVGDDEASANSLACDYVVLSLEQAADRSDADALPIVARYWPRIDDQAARTDHKSWLTAKDWLITLSQELYLSPDLTRAQAERMYQQYVSLALDRHNQAKELTTLAPGALAPSDVRVLQNIADAIRTL